MQCIVAHAISNPNRIWVASQLLGANSYGLESQWHVDLILWLSKCTPAQWQHYRDDPDDFALPFRYKVCAGSLLFVHPFDVGLALKFHYRRIQLSSDFVLPVGKKNHLDANFLTFDHSCVNLVYNMTNIVTTAMIMPIQTMRLCAIKPRHFVVFLNEQMTYDFGGPLSLTIVVDRPQFTLQMNCFRQVNAVHVRGAMLAELRITGALDYRSQLIIEAPRACQITFDHPINYRLIAM